MHFTVSTSSEAVWGVQWCGRCFHFRYIIFAEYDLELQSLRTPSSVGLCGSQQIREEAGTSAKSTRTSSGPIYPNYSEDKGDWKIDLRILKQIDFPYSYPKMKYAFVIDLINKYFSIGSSSSQSGKIRSRDWGGVPVESGSCRSCRRSSRCCLHSLTEWPRRSGGRRTGRRRQWFRRAGRRRGRQHIVHYSTVTNLCSSSNEARWSSLATHNCQQLPPTTRWVEDSYLFWMFSGMKNNLWWSVWSNRQHIQIVFISFVFTVDQTVSYCCWFSYRWLFVFCDFAEISFYGKLWWIEVLTFDDYNCLCWGNQLVNIRI